MVYTALKRDLEGLCRNILGNMSFRFVGGFMGATEWCSACESGIKYGFYGSFAKKAAKFPLKENKSGIKAHNGMF